MSTDDPRPERFEPAPPLPWSRGELALFALLAALIAAAVLLTFW